jgi:hypothetical protein
LGRPPVNDARALERRVTEHPLDQIFRLLGRFVMVRSKATILGKVKGLLGVDLFSGLFRAMVTPEDVFIQVDLDPEIPTELKALIDDARGLLGKIDAGYKTVRTFSSASDRGDVPFFVTGRKLDRLMARPPEGGVEEKGKLEVALHRRNPHFLKIQGLYPKAPALASYMLAKSLLLSEDRLLDRDLTMIEAALRQEDGQR